MAGAFRYKIWDPPLIISQIITMQAVFYVGLGIWVASLDLFTGHHRSLDSLFKYQELQVKEVHGRTVMAAFILNALTSSLGLWKVVQRTKQCLDFTVTAHVIHLCASWWYNGHLPSQPSVWLLNLVTITLMCVLGEYLCMRTEMQHIPVLGSSKVDL
ncbi:protein SYS1 homolog [Eriocheir sinensis]|uniref:protein SYS1 homolog n=1 Tax=Eriocheir sinensis TaxID=95602 RepID=UPI0021C709C5|nr:protein SYS1 homolog [Eriocheir sinensis]